MSNYHFCLPSVYYTKNQKVEKQDNDGSPLNDAMTSISGEELAIEKNAANAGKQARNWTWGQFLSTPVVTDPATTLENLADKVNEVSTPLQVLSTLKSSSYVRR